MNKIIFFLNIAKGRLNTTRPILSYVLINCLYLQMTEKATVFYIYYCAFTKLNEALGCHHRLTDEFYPCLRGEKTPRER